MRGKTLGAEGGDLGHRARLGCARVRAGRRRAPSRARPRSPRPRRARARRGPTRPRPCPRSGRRPPPRTRGRRRARPAGGRGPSSRPTPAREPGPQRARIEREPADRVDERQPVGARRDDRARRLRDVPLRGRELRVERLRRRPARRGDELGRRLGRLLDVRARQVQLDRGDPVVARRGARSRARSRPPRSRRPRPRAGTPSSASRGRLCPDERVDPGPLQADRVQHSVLGLRDPDGWVARARERRDRLRHDDVERARDVGRRQRVEAARRR